VPVSSLSVPQRTAKPNTADGPKPSSVSFKTSQPKQPTANQDVGDGGHVYPGAVNQIMADSVARIPTPSGDSPQNVSSTKNVYICQDATVTNGALNSVETYPREV